MAAPAGLEPAQPSTDRCLRLYLLSYGAIFRVAGMGRPPAFLSTLLRPAASVYRPPAVRLPLKRAGRHTVVPFVLPSFRVDDAAKALFLAKDLEVGVQPRSQIRLL